MEKEHRPKPMKMELAWVVYSLFMPLVGWLIYLFIY